MPKSSNKKKSKKRGDRSVKAFSCEGCSIKLEKDNFIYCECTQVKFCSSSCQSDHPHTDCPGPPETEFDINKRLQKYKNEGKTLEGDVKNRQQDELYRTVNKPSQDYMLSKGFQDLGKYASATAWDYAELADEGISLGNQACAYLAGSRFRHRVLSSPSVTGRGHQGSLMVRNKEKDNIPVLESQKLAFKYFEKAAKLGHALAMQSLATCFDEGVGCKENRRRCNQWLWRSCLEQSEGAFELLDSRALLPLEINANAGMLDQTMHRIPYGQCMQLGGPNLGALLLVFKETLMKENFTLPPFAGSVATGSVGNLPVQNNQGPRVPVIGGKAAQVLCKKIQSEESRGKGISLAYGRRGTAKAATAQTYGSSARAIDNQIYVVPPFAACDESVTLAEEGRWMQQSFAFPEPINMFCVHSEKYSHSIRKPNALFCPECKSDAKERLDAVARGSLVLSIEEEISQRGNGAIYRKEDGTIKMETWKYYSRGEAECVLATIAASGMSPYTAPLFIAQDPNFFYPLILDHGSIRAALEYVSPHIDWDGRVGPVKYNMKEQVPLLPGFRPGQYARKCGNPFCIELGDYKTNGKREGFSSCTGCNRRYYCCKNCQVADWSVHKHECKTSAKGKAPDPRLNDSTSDGNATKPARLKHNTQVEPGQDYVVHGLKVKPEFNGKVALVQESIEDGRFSVALRGGKHLSIKPENLHHVGVFVRKRKKKSRVFECVHGLQVCDSCYLDFTTVNRLTQLKYNKQDMTSIHAVEHVNDVHFSAFDLRGDEEEFSRCCQPIECHGMENHEKQSFILKSLLGVDVPMTVNAEVAKTAYVTFGAGRHQALRAYTRLDEVAQFL